MKLAVQPSKVFLDGHDLLSLRESKCFLACFENPSRRRNIPMHPTGTRVAMVWDQFGFVAYEDLPEGLMSHLILAFDPKETPEHPNHASISTIEINGGIVTAETLERTMPKNGPTPISADFGKHYVYGADAFSVHFNFKRGANPRGRHVSIGRLISVSFSWKTSVIKPNQSSHPTLAFGQRG